LLAGACVLTPILVTEPADNRPIVLWLAVGILAGLALLSKYSSVLVITGALAFMLTLPSGRRALTSPGPWLGALLALLLFAPVLIWNAEHHWTSFVFQGARARPNAFKFTWIAQFVAGQIAYVSPWIFLPMLYALWRALERGRFDRRSWFLVCLSLGPILVFTAVAFWSRVLPHWSMPGWLFVFPLLGKELAQLEESRPGLLRSCHVAATIALAIAITALGTHAVTGWMTRLLKVDPLEELLDWTQVKNALVRHGVPQENLFVAGFRWHTSAKLAYALGPAVMVYCLCDQPHQFGLDQDIMTVRGQVGVIAVPIEQLSRQLPEIAGMFQDIEVLPPVPLLRGDVPSKWIALVRGTRFMPPIHR
jgi:4-amino-4-deoxy-L-arabinose transferase-like glycosyltransferase